MAEIFVMNAGDGAQSYSKNSEYQKEGSDLVKGIIQEVVLHKLDAETISGKVAIADLGCSVGPNTLFTVENLIQAVKNKCPESGYPEFHVFFNDHTANDFNTLFASLPAPPDREYYAAGVPGSFHGRLFPRGSITLAHSAFALQWLSKQPQGVANEGRIHYTGASAEVVRAYLDQFERDMGVFMDARGEEMVKGGLMFLIMPGVPDGVSHSLGVLVSLLGDCLMELSKEGVVDEGEIEAFNLPIYFPRAEEMRRVVERNGCFSIEKMELMNPWRKVGLVDGGGAIMHLRAAVEGILTAQFGGGVVEKAFARVSAKNEEISHLMESVNPNSSAQLFVSTQLFLVLKRN